MAILTALKGNIGSRAAAVGISVKQDPQLDLMRRSKNTVGDIQAELSRRMVHWPNDEARTHDERSVWAMLRIRDANTLCTRICDSKAVFITRNTALAQAANDAWRTQLVFLLTELAPPADQSRQQLKVNRIREGRRLHDGVGLDPSG